MFLIEMMIFYRNELSNTVDRLLRMIRPLFVGSYLQVTWWAFDQWKGKKFASNDKMKYSDFTAGKYFF